MKNTKTKFYQTTWFMWLMLIFIAPVGIVLMWSYHKNYSRIIKIVLSVVFSVFFIGLITPNDNTGDTNTAEITVTPNTTISPTEVSSIQEQSSNKTASNKNEPKKTPKPTKKPTKKEIFTNSLSSETAIKKKVCRKLYVILHDKMKFKDLEYAGKNSVGNANYDINADDVSLMASMDNNGIYRIICGDFVLYENGKVRLTKKQMNNRYIDSNEEVYYNAYTQLTVENYLKAPSTAKFCSSSELGMKQVGKYVIVQGYVDAQNSFGAMIRNNFTVEFKINGDYKDSNYTLVYMNLDGTEVGSYKELK